MPKVFEQHAHQSEYHLRTFYVDGKWDWQAQAINNRRLPEYTETCDTPDAAKESAAKSIGLAFANWMPIGPGIELPD
ncbi:MAG TPA: hypothetical protein VHC90_09485 [Bryobacteraceae bacterium]|nr:hypothetical protein [Bryobacteraceae bacterium]